MKVKILFFLFIFTNYLFCAKEEKGPVGIVNQGSTCYMNAALQCLYNVEPLTNFLLKQKDTDYFIQEYKIKGTDEKVSSIPREYIKLVEILSKRETPVAPITFCERMWPAMSYPEPPRPRTQDDSAQFIQILIEQLSDLGVNKKFVKTRYGFPRNNIAKSYVSDLFNIGLKTKITCPDAKCNLTTSEGTIEPVLALPVISQKEKSDLNEMLKQFFAKEKLDPSEAKWTNKKEFDQFKQYTILAAPPFLIFQLKIFDNLGNKLTIPIRIPVNNLDLSQYLDQSEAIEKISTYTNLSKEVSDIIGAYSTEIKYDLVGIVQHSGGTINSGHYTAFVKYENRWYYCDDDSTKPFDSIDDFEKYGFSKITWGGSTFNPYILFYKKQTPGITKAYIKPISEKELLDKLNKFNITKKDVDNFVNSKPIPTDINDLVNGINYGFMTIEKLADFIEDFKAVLKRQAEKNESMMNQLYSLNISLRTLS